MCKLSPAFRIDKPYFHLGLITVIISIILFGLFSCNPLKQVQKNLGKSEKARGELAKLCSEQFPPSTVCFMPGAVDTNGIVNGILGSLQRLCPEYLPQYLPNNKEADYTPNYLPNRDSGSKLFKIPSSFVDSFINQQKKHIKPDTIIKRDSAALVALRYQNKALAAVNTDLVNQHVKDTISVINSTAKSQTRLWVIIALAVALVGSNGIWIYSKFKV